MEVVPEKDWKAKKQKHRFKGLLQYPGGAQVMMAVLTGKSRLNIALKKGFCH